MRQITNPEAGPAMEPPPYTVRTFFLGTWWTALGYLRVGIVAGTVTALWMFLRWVLIGDGLPTTNAERYCMAAAGFFAALVDRRRSGLSPAPEGKE